MKPIKFLSIISSLLNRLLGKKCPFCGSRKRTYSPYRWTRGWNNLCSQACGDAGWYCNDCGKIEWERSIEEYKSILPSWCYAYEPKKSNKTSRILK